MASSDCWVNLVLVATVLAVVRAETHPGKSNLQFQVTEQLLEISHNQDLVVLAIHHRVLGVEVQVKHLKVWGVAMVVEAAVVAVCLTPATSVF